MTRRDKLLLFRCFIVDGDLNQNNMKLLAEMHISFTPYFYWFKSRAASCGRNLLLSVCCIFKGDLLSWMTSVHIPLLYLFSFLHDTLKHVYQEYSMCWTWHQWSCNCSLCHMWDFFLNFNGFCGWKQLLDPVVDLCDVKITGKLYYCSKNSPFYCSVLKRFSSVWGYD